MSGTIDKGRAWKLLRRVKPLYADGALTITPFDMISEGQQMAAEARSHAKLRDGREYADAYHFKFEIDEDRLVSVREYSDTQHMLEIFGPQAQACAQGDVSRSPR